MLGLYIHIPFCVQKCKYCDFASYVGKEGDIPMYLKAAEREMQKYKGYKIDTIFIGGGTPSVLSEHNIYELSESINKNFSVSEDAEFTAEVNPDTVTDKKIKAFKSIGVNRISMGVQSFSDTELRLLGRVHDSRRAASAAEIISRYIDNYSFDIMTGIPNQTMESLKHTLDTAFSLNPSHLSCYSLIIEEGTEFYRLYEENKLNQPDEDTDREMYHFLCAYLEENGYNRYEISNFAKNNRQCRHNLKYWSCDEYIGIGAAAHSYLNSERFFNTKSINEYISGNMQAGSEHISENDKISEFIIMGLRKTEGISTELFKSRFGKDIFSLFGDTVQKFITGGFLEERDGFLRLTGIGTDVSNSIMCEFV